MIKYALLKNWIFSCDLREFRRILERFFRDLKRKYRKRSGTVSLSKALRFILADTALVKNLDNPEYLQIFLDGRGNLQEWFAKIDSHLVAEQLKAERKNQERIGLR